MYYFSPCTVSSAPFPLPVAVETVKEKLTKMKKALTTFAALLVTAFSRAEALRAAKQGTKNGKCKIAYLKVNYHKLLFSLIHVRGGQISSKIF